MKNKSIFEEVYGRVDVVDYDSTTSTFVRTRSIYFLGEASNHAKSVEDINVKNKKLVAGLGRDIVKRLGTNTEPIDISISGGDDWDELDEMDFEELLNTDSVLINDSIADKGIKTSKDIEHQTDIISNLVFYSRDKLSDIREKVAIASGIKPYKQYLWSSLTYESLTGDKTSLMSHWKHSIRRIEEYPIDGRALDSQSVSFTLPLKHFSEDSIVIFVCINLDSIINKSSLSFIAKSDVESYELIHSNAIERFFPLINQSVLNQYLSDESLIEDKFPSYYFNLKHVKESYQKRAQLISELNKQPMVTIDTTTLLTASATDLTLYQKIDNGDDLIDTLELFRKMNIVKYLCIASIDFYTYNRYQSYRLRKTPQRDRLKTTKDESIAFTGLHTRKSMVQTNLLVIQFLPQERFISLTINLDKFGNLWIRGKPSQNITMSKSEFVKIISGSVNSIIELINSIDSAFPNSNRLSPLDENVSILSSSSRLNFKFPISFDKFSNLIISKLLLSGLVKPSLNQTNAKRLKSNSSEYILCYGVSFDNEKKVPGLEIKDTQGITVLDLINLDLEETNLYIDIIGRLILEYSSKIKTDTTSHSQLQIVDPVLFRPKVLSDAYSRICQKKFQPEIAKSDDPHAVEYYNFTFNRPEYYKCPSKSAPVLGFIQGKHSSGYCLPCCRKTEQVNFESLKSSCISNEPVENANLSTYKVDYPIPEIPNSKIMNRRILLPDYITQLFGTKSIVANGTIMSSHGHIRDGIKPNIKSYLQTATIIAAIKTDGKESTPLYSTYREFILDAIALIKEPTAQINIMKHRLVSGRYTTPQALINAMEEHYIKEHVLEPTSLLSAVEWNDFIIFLANCMGMNVLLLSDDRDARKSIEMVNIHDIDATKPVLCLLKRLNIEWSSLNHNTRALYLPITFTSFKVYWKSPLFIERLDFSKNLTKIKRLTSGTAIKMIEKQLTIQRLKAFTQSNSMYKVIPHEEQKLAVVQIGKNKLITSVSTMSITSKHSPLRVAPTASFGDLLNFVRSYNNFILGETQNLEKVLNSYKLYLNALKSASNTLEYVSASAFLIKIKRVIVNKDTVIGCLVEAIDVNRVISTEIIFFKPTKQNAIISELKKLKQEFDLQLKKTNAKVILSFPVSTFALSDSQELFTDWLISPLDIPEVQELRCKLSTREPFNRGLYMSEIYNILTKVIFENWKNEVSHELKDFIVMKIKSMGLPPYTQIKIDRLIKDIANSFSQYDPSIIRIELGFLFESINQSSKSSAQSIKQIKDSEVFKGIDVLNVHRLNKHEIRKKLLSLMKEHTKTVSVYPDFESVKIIKDQIDKFYDSKTQQVLIHKDVLEDVLDCMVSDLMNPFRRDYIIHKGFIDQIAFENIIPFEGEMIYIKPIKV